MAAKKISQREARRLQKRVSELMRNERERNNRWSSSFPGGINIATLELNPISYAKIDIARRLGFALVVTIGSSERSILVHAVRS